METGEDVLASEESVQGGVSNQEGGVFHVNAAGGGGRDLRSSRKKKLTRKVSFPEDSQLVRALDPVDPWEHGKYLSLSGFIFSNTETETVIILKLQFLWFSNIISGFASNDSAES